MSDSRKMKWQEKRETGDERRTVRRRPNVGVVSDDYWRITYISGYITLSRCANSPLTFLLSFPPSLLPPFHATSLRPSETPQRDDWPSTCTHLPLAGVSSEAETTWWLIRNLTSSNEHGITINSEWVDGKKVDCETGGGEGTFRRLRAIANP